MQSAPKRIKGKPLVFEFAKGVLGLYREAI